MTLLSTQYKTPRHPSYRSNPFTTIPHPTGNPLRAKKILPVSRVHALFQICFRDYYRFIYGFHFRRRSVVPPVYSSLFSLAICKDRNQYYFRNQKLYKNYISVYHDLETNVPLFGKRENSRLERKNRREKKKKEVRTFERGKRGGRGWRRLSMEKKKKKKNRRVMFSRRNFSSDEFLSFSLSSVLQYASARLLLIFQRPFSSRFYRLWLKNLYRETAKQLVVKRLSSTMRRKCACSRFNGIDWVWSKSPFGQIISTHFRFRRPVPIPDEGISRGKKEKEKKKKGRRSLISFPDRQFEIQF